MAPSKEDRKAKHERRALILGLFLEARIGHFGGLEVNQVHSPRATEPVGALGMPSPASNFTTTYFAMLCILLVS